MSGDRSNPSVVILQLPSPPRKNVFREWSGGMGTALVSKRESWGHDPGFYDIPYSPFLYIASRLDDAGVRFDYVDFQARTSVALEEFDGLFKTGGRKILVTQVNLPSLTHDLELVARVRAIEPGIFVILVGATAKWFKERILASGLADAIMLNSEELLVSENIIAALGTARQNLQACAVWREGRVVELPARQAMANLNFIAFPAYKLLDFNRYESAYYGGHKTRYATVFTSKGCPYSCNYCPYPYGFGDKLVYRSPDRVGADIERLHREFGVRQILFRDQVFTINRRHASAICEELIRRNLGITWVCETRYDVVDADLIALMKRAGCIEIHFGLESADETMFASVAKTDGPKSLELFERAIGWVKQAGLRAHVHLIVGMPDESSSTVRNTTRWLRRVKPDSVQFAYFVPYPGTPIFAELRQSRELGDVEAIDWERMGAFEGPVLPSRHLSIPQVRRALQRMGVDWQYSLADRAIAFLKRAIGRLAPAARA